ncbi:MAG: WD40/YVTN/BNR-like repeat-containing protein, partial [Vicinamibacterales bacterium]
MKSVSVPRRTSWVRVALIVTAGLIAAFALPVTAQQSPDLYKSIVFRDIGPTRQGNRYVDFAVVESTPRVFYAAAATGGLFKTETNGLNFTPVFENQPVASIGAVAVSQSKPDVIYLGTGEGNNSRSSYWGDGVYVSTDGAKTWTHAGLSDSQHIGRIVVHPTDPNTAYVAALGHLYSDNDERGLYKTTDGGKTWTKSLDLKEAGKAVGVVDVAMDPKNPLVLYAAAYAKVRRPWSFAAGAPGSGLYKTIDGGKTWTKLTTGLPTGILGRMGLSIYRQDPNVVFAVIETVNSTPERVAQGFGESLGSTLYRSDDAGKTWKQVAPPPPAAATGEVAAPPAAAGRGTGAAAAGRGAGGPAIGDTPYYYSQVRVDPNDKQHIFLLSTSASQTFDGGATWQGLGAGGDNHALWIDPKDSGHMLLGYDHGISITFDAGAHWYHPDNMPGAQLYAVGFDMATPYNVYGGLQDNGSHKGPSTMPGGAAIPFEAWSTVGGGDGQYNVVDWKESRYLYNESQFGSITRTDMVTGESAGIQYRRPQAAPGGAGAAGAPGTGSGQDPLRWNWCAPILVSPHNPDVIYHGANVLLRSPLRGTSWEEISPDLTANDLTKRAVSTPCDTCGSGNVTYATISTIDESPIVPGLLWAGTDDGNVQVSKDGGRSWTNVRGKIPGHPGYWVSRVEASHAAAGTAYVTVTGMRNDDFRPFIWRTNDFGETWTSIAANLPKESINVVREDPRNANLLFVGTDLGVYVSQNAGISWSKLRG